MRPIHAVTALLLTALRPGQQGVEPVPDPHHHLVPVHRRPWSTELAPAARLVPLQTPATRHDSVRSPDGRWWAFIIERPEEPGGRIAVAPAGRGGGRELAGIPLPYRPVSDLVWLDDRRLAFDRWSQPHYGVHYVLDVRAGRLALAAPFPDAFMLHQQRP